MKVVSPPLLPFFTFEIIRERFLAVDDGEIAGLVLWVGGGGGGGLYEPRIGGSLHRAAVV